MMRKYAYFFMALKEAEHPVSILEHMCSKTPYRFGAPYDITRGYLQSERGVSVSHIWVCARCKHWRTISEIPSHICFKRGAEKKKKWPDPKPRPLKEELPTVHSVVTGLPWFQKVMLKGDINGEEMTEFTYKYKQRTLV